MTRRYIGEYRSKTDLLYRQTISLDSGLLDVEIVDVSAETDNEFPIEQIQWADSCLIVYSITDRERCVENWNQMCIFFLHLMQRFNCFDSIKQ